MKKSQDIWDSMHAFTCLRSVFWGWIIFAALVFALLVMGARALHAV